MYSITVCGMQGRVRLTSAENRFSGEGQARDDPQRERPGGDQEWKRWDGIIRSFYSKVLEAPQYFPLIYSTLQHNSPTQTMSMQIGRSHHGAESMVADAISDETAWSRWGPRRRDPMAAWMFQRPGRPAGPPPVYGPAKASGETDRAPTGHEQRPCTTAHIAASSISLRHFTTTLISPH